MEPHMIVTGHPPHVESLIRDGDHSWFRRLLMREPKPPRSRETIAPIRAKLVSIADHSAHLQAAYVAQINGPRLPVKATQAQMRRPGAVGNVLSPGILALLGQSYAADA